MSIEYPPGATPLTVEEMEGLKFKHVTTRQQLDHLEQANIESGLLWLSRYKGNDILTEAFVKESHRRLFGEVWDWAGSFRQTEKNIGVDPLQIGVQLRNILDDAQYWIDHSTYEPLELAVRCHHRLVYVHCFANGNGRHARILADTILEKVLHESPVNWSGGYNLQEMNRRRTEYIKALRAADGGDIQPLLAFVSTADD